MPAIKTFKQVQGMIRTIGTTSAKLDKLVHETAVQCLLHAEAHGDIRLMGSLLEQLAKGYRRKGLTVWMEMYSPIRVNGDGKIGLLKPENKRYVRFDVAQAEATPFWTIKEADEKVAKDLTIETIKGMVAGMLKKIDRAEQGEGSYIIPEGTNVTALRNYVKALQTVQPTVVEEVAA